MPASSVIAAAAASAGPLPPDRRMPPMSVNVLSGTTVPMHAPHSPDGSDQLDELLRRLRTHALRDAEPDARGLIGWLRRQIDADIAVVDGHARTQAATPGFPPDTVTALRPVLAQLTSGRLRAATRQVGAWQVRCEALGRHVPRPVLMVAAPSPLTREAGELVSHTGTVLEVLHRLKRVDDLTDRYRRMAERYRLAVFMTLMAGDLATARRATVGSVPPLLEAEHLCVHLLRCEPRDRSLLAEAHQDGSGYHGRGLMVLCPVYDEHLICLVPADEAQAAEPCGLAGLLRSLVRDNPHYALGISAPHPPEATAEAYEQAYHALAIAQQKRDRIAAYQGDAPLAGLLPRRPALRWARTLLRPLSPMPRLTFEVTRLALSFPRSGVARLLGISRNTVTAHLRRVEEALGVDLRRVRHRADIALAMAISSLPDSAEDAPAGDPPAPTLEGLLSTDAAVTWARAFLRPLQDEEHRPVLATLRAWVEADADAQRTARALGISRTTVRSRLRTAERLLNRDLLTAGFGTHDVVHALRVADCAP